ncbi:MAG TPA: hypothetical protein ENI96_03345 [Sedimenticola thiotaurini]|uniref:NarX-like N-terminal domain-containing protein n=1 Tax=Sedimenticola thiotaurini TaxID=1543721 RepID=A0A831RMY3_9GAMM|nr:hypothetical protein [Sedimenticola thiotaurini]
MNYRTLFSLLPLLIIALLPIPPASAAPITTMGEAINQAGRQRMLTQRIVKSYCQMGQDVRYLVAAEDLTAAIALFEQQLENLKRYVDDGEILRTLDRVEALWQPVKQIATDDVSRDQAESLRALAETLLASAHKVVLQLERKSGSSQGHLVNIAGRQRMLTQRMGSLYLLRSWGFDNPRYRADYEQAMREFDSALQELMSAPENTPEINRELKKVAQNWAMYKLGNRTGEGRYVPTLVVRMLDKMLVQMNRITGMYARLPAG